MPVVRIAWITRAQLRMHYTWLWVYGDNMQRRGYGGQAREMRGEPNAVGIPTKWAPLTYEGAYFTDADLAAAQPVIELEVAKLRTHLQAGGTVVIPTAGIGTGLADLPNRAPAIAALIDRLLAELQSTG